jgi:CD109 antigen
MLLQYIAIQDSIVAMEALTEYAYRARLREITEMTVLVEASASPNANQLVQISSDNLASIHKLEVS